jgi:CHAT domain-containing protein/Flp pilus assembly protein TadD
LTLSCARTLVAAAFLLAVGCRSPQATYDGIKNQIDHGEFDAALMHVNQALRKQSTNSEWGWRFRLLKARVLVSRKEYKETLALLDQDVPPNLLSSDIAEQRKLFQGMAHRNAQNFVLARKAFDEAAAMASHLGPSARCQLLIAVGDLEVDEKNYAQAEQSYRNALALARQEKLPIYELTVLTDLGRLAPSEERFDKAIDANRSALELSYSLGARGYAATILGNLAWSYSELGDFESARDYFQRGATASESSGLPVLAAYWLTGIANSDIALHDYTAAEQLTENTLSLARGLKNAQTITECLNILTKIAVRTGRFDHAEKHNKEALMIERSGRDRFGISDSLILAGQIARAKGRPDEAEGFFRQVLDDTKAETPLRWEARAGLAGARDNKGRTTEAEKLYKQAIATIEKARGSIHHDELRLSFLSTGIEVYGEYIDFLIRYGRPDDALRQADLSRARTLAEGLSTKLVAASASSPRVQPQELARRLHATLLVYWLGEHHSYLWAVTPSKTKCFPLPPASEIDSLIKSYRDLSLKSEDVLKNATTTGEKLYASLIAPAQKLIAPGSRVIVLPDASLYSLNFETLIVPGPQPHFWIEDVTVTTASSLSLLASAQKRTPPKQNSLLLVGDAVPVPEFGPLPQAAAEIQKVRPYFTPQRRSILQGPQATPKAYLESHAERFSYLHFVTHGTASRARPLESAVVLSKESDGDTYKLYARDIVTHPLHAELVTISACNGSGTRAYSGEGLVGLSWAFLRAGAHNVIGALWEVSDVSTPQLMDKMYAELAAGKDPATALRNAKLAFLHADNVFAKPFYWAPFQLYSGS